MGKNTGWDRIKAFVVDGDFKYSCGSTGPDKWWFRFRSPADVKDGELQYKVKASGLSLEDSMLKAAIRLEEQHHADSK